MARSGGVVDGGSGNGGEGGKQRVDPRTARGGSRRPGGAGEPAESPIERSWAGVDFDDGGTSGGRRRAKKTLAWDVDEELVCSEKVCAQNGALHISQDKLMCNTQSRNCLLYTSDAADE